MIFLHFRVLVINVVFIKALDDFYFQIFYIKVYRLPNLEMFLSYTIYSIIVNDNIRTNFSRNEKNEPVYVKSRRLFRKYPSHDLPFFKYRLEIQTKIFLVSSVLAQTCRPHHRVAEIVSLVLLLNALLCCTVGNQAYFLF